MTKLNLKVSTYLGSKYCLRLVVPKYFGLIFDTDQFDGNYRRSKLYLLCLLNLNMNCSYCGVLVLPLFVDCWAFSRRWSLCSLGILIFKDCKMTQLCFHSHSFSPFWQNHHDFQNATFIEWPSADLVPHNIQDQYPMAKDTLVGSSLFLFTLLFHFSRWC